MQLIQFAKDDTETPRIGENIYNTITSQIGAPVEAPLAAYILTMIECAGGNINTPAAHPQKFNATFEHYLRQIDCPGKVLKIT